MQLPAQPPVLRQRVRAELEQAPRPLTARQLADRLLPPGHESGHQQTMRALKQLEAAGHATRRLAAGGRYAWTIR
jgi:Fe2+ or Zn2+ uptake regulation protein